MLLLSGWRLQEIEPDVVCWKGATILACLDTTQELWIRQKEWNTFDVRMLRERAPFVWWGQPDDSIVDQQLSPHGVGLCYLFVLRVSKHFTGGTHLTYTCYRMRRGPLFCGEGIEGFHYSLVKHSISAWCETTWPLWGQGIQGPEEAAFKHRAYPDISLTNLYDCKTLAHTFHV